MKILTRGDKLAAEQLAHTIEHDPGYQTIRARLEREREQTMRDLLNAPTWDHTQRLQERVQTLDMVLALPRHLLAELRK